MRMRAAKTTCALGVAGALVLWCAGRGLCAGIIQQITDYVPSSPHSYEQMLSTLSQLQGTGRVSLFALGNSVKGRSVVAVAVHSPGASFEQTRRILVLARQHGGEPAGTEATLALIRHFATSQGELEVGTLRLATMIFVPMANPDGAAANRRANANGVDLNRDWVAQTQPETRAIERAVQYWKPHALMDLHELPRSSPRPEYAVSFVETIGEGAGIARSVSACTVPAALDISGWLRSYGHRANIFYNGAHKDRRLCHRHFGLSRGVPSFLVESKTGAGRSLQQRASLHVLCTLVVVNHLLNSGGASTVLPPQAPSPQVAQADGADGPCSVRVRFNPSDDGDGTTGSLEAVVTGGRGVRYVKFLLDGNLWLISNLAPYQCPLDTGQLEEGTHRLQVEVVGSGGTVLSHYQRQIIVGETSAMAE